MKVFEFSSGGQHNGPKSFTREDLMDCAHAHYSQFGRAHTAAAIMGFCRFDTGKVQTLDYKQLIAAVPTDLIEPLIACMCDHMSHRPHRVEHD
jgi:hypothetical protein